MPVGLYDISLLFLKHDFIRIDCGPHVLEADQFQRLSTIMQSIPTRWLQSHCMC